MSQRIDVAVIGAGIVGLAFAAEAARRGRRVAIFERDRAAVGASVRNFGMIWPIGQRPGADYQRALRSRGKWLDAAKQAGIWAAECGSLHVATRDDEATVLTEFAASNALACEWLTADATCKRFPAVNAAGLKGALYSPTELAVDPRQAIERLPRWLNAAFNVEIHTQTAITSIHEGVLQSSTGERWSADRIFVCSGADLETLYPEFFARSGIRRCKLQMMRTTPQPDGWQLGTHVAGGLTLAHYSAFEKCPSLPALKKRLAQEMPAYVRYGIHVMAAQNERGEVVIGDSHEYDEAISPFDKAEIDDLILQYLRTFLRLPDERIASRWHGIYAKHPTRTIVIEEVEPKTTVVVAPGGAGMTLSFGFAEDWWNENG
jgi:FAD dependent oxidoreductase TIGR03364